MAESNPFLEGVKEGIGEETLQRMEQLAERTEQVTPDVVEGFVSSITDPIMWVISFILAIGVYVTYRYLRYGRKTLKEYKNKKSKGKASSITECRNCNHPLGKHTIDTLPFTCTVNGCSCKEYS